MSDINFATELSGDDSDGLIKTTLKGLLQQLDKMALSLENKLHLGGARESLEAACDKLLEHADQCRLLNRSWKEGWTRSIPIYTASLEIAARNHPGLIGHTLQRAMLEMLGQVLSFTKDPDDFPANKTVLANALRTYLDCRNLGASHSLDFTSVNWFGTGYQFKKGLQAESIRVLWEAWEKGTPSVSEQTIGERAGSASDRFRLDHIFNPTNKKTRKRKTHPAWGTMIQSAGKGTFALVCP